ncbi:MAG: class B sortase, partial [Clostridia bacterium]|nr:class B sortase [Clostridia bacterium]
SGDNDTYLHRGFDGKYSRSGTLFFEQSNIIKEGVSNKVTIIYGHNMASGTMFAPLNKVIGNVYRARSAATFNLDTLYDSGQYKVFAVVISDEGADAAHRFGYLRTAFADDDDFMSYVDELRARSLFDYPVDVQPNDELVILSTCTNKSQVKVADGRCAIIARRVRDGENTTTDTAKIVKNDDVIMPYAWYTAQDLTPHAFYTQDDFVVPETDNSTTTATTGDTGTTDTDTTTTQTTTANTTENGTTDSATTTTQTTVGTTTETVATTQTTTDVTENTTTSTETNTTS